MHFWHIILGDFEERNGSRTACWAMFTGWCGWALTWHKQTRVLLWVNISWPVFRSQRVLGETKTLLFRRQLKNILKTYNFDEGEAVPPLEEHKLKGPYLPRLKGETSDFVCFCRTRSGSGLWFLQHPKFWRCDRRLEREGDFHSNGLVGPYSPVISNIAIAGKWTLWLSRCISY